MQCFNELERTIVALLELLGGALHNTLPSCFSISFAQTGVRGVAVVAQYKNFDIFRNSGLDDSVHKDARKVNVVRVKALCG